jgi:hypothetical protein
MLMIQVIRDIISCCWLNSFQKFKVTAFLLLRQAGQDAIMQDVTNIFKCSFQLKICGARPSTVAVVDIVCVCVYVSINHKIFIHIEDLLVK